MLHIRNIGGGKVLRRFTIGGETLLSGHELTAERIQSIPIRNRTTLIENGYLGVWPAPPPPPAPEPGVRYVVSRGKGRYDVVEGRKLNEAPLSQAEAEALAGAPSAEAEGADGANQTGG